MLSVIYAMTGESGVLPFVIYASSLVLGERGCTAVLIAMAPIKFVIKVSNSEL